MGNYAGPPLTYVHLYIGEGDDRLSNRIFFEVDAIYFADGGFFVIVFDLCRIE